METQRHARVENDQYPTPEWVVEEFLKVSKCLDNLEAVIEPCAGFGSIAEVLNRHGVTVYANEIMPSAITALSVYCKERVWIGDWFKNKDDIMKFVAKRHDLRKVGIITNPPYYMVQEFVESALETNVRYVGKLMRLGFLAAIKRYEFWMKNALTSLHPLCGRPSYVHGGTDRYDYAWYAWDRGRPYRAERRLAEITPILKPELIRKRLHAERNLG